MNGYSSDKNINRILKYTQTLNKNEREYIRISEGKVKYRNLMMEELLSLM